MDGQEELFVVSFLWTLMTKRKWNIRISEILDCSRAFLFRGDHERKARRQSWQLRMFFFPAIWIDVKVAIFIFDFSLQ